MEVKELMPDNSALMLQLTELGPSQSASAGKLREIDDPLTWVFYLLSFFGHHKRAKELATYGQVIVHLAQRHGAEVGKHMIVSFVSRTLPVPITHGQSPAPL